VVTIQFNPPTNVPNDNSGLSFIELAASDIQVTPAHRAALSLAATIPADIAGACASSPFAQSGLDF
jgi:hypothetical protein